jgi:hypothetical protein
MCRALLALTLGTLSVAACGPSQYQLAQQSISDACWQHAAQVTQGAIDARANAYEEPSDNRVSYGIIGGILGYYAINSPITGAKLGIAYANATDVRERRRIQPLTQDEANRIYNNIYERCWNSETNKLNQQVRQQMNRYGYPQSGYFRGRLRY